MNIPVSKNIAINVAPIDYEAQETQGVRVATKAKASHKTEGVRPDGSVSVSGVNVGEHSVEARRQLARKQAMRVVQDAYGNERDMDKNLSDIGDSLRRLRAENTELTRTQQDNEAKLAELKEKYGVADDSEEQRGLERAVLKVNGKDGMSKEDFEQLTDYQKEALFYAADHSKNEKQMAINEGAMTANVQAKTDLTTERLKSRAMIDAEKQADEIMDAADKDAIAMLTQDAVQQIDDRAEEEKEAAEKRKEEEKEEKKEAAKKLEQEARQEELIEKSKARNAQFEEGAANAKRAAARRLKDDATGSDAQTATTDAAMSAQSMSDTQAAVSSEVTNILNKLSLLTEDVKGASIDGAL